MVGLIWGLSVMAPLARGTLQPLQGMASQLSLSSLDDASLADIFEVSGRCLADCLCINAWPCRP